MKRITFVVIMMSALAQAASAGEFLRSAEPVPGNYFVRLKENLGLSSSAIASRLANEHRVSVTHVYSRVLQGFAFEGTETAAKALAHNPHVLYVREAAYGHLTSTQTPVGSSGLDRIDQRTLPLDNSYTYNETGAGTKIYIIDTGVNNVPELAGRIVGNASFVPYESWTNDCHNHGTFVASIAAGSIHGVAKGASIVNYRVANCQGQLTSNSVTSALDSVYAAPGERVVANLSLTFFGGNADVDHAVQSLVNRGVLVVTSAGLFYEGSYSDACSASPSRLGPDSGVITVSAVSDDYVWGTNTPDGWAVSSTGPCVDIFAPTGIAASNADGVETLFYGTSASAPIVAGIAALVLQRNPGLAGNAAGVEMEVGGNATAGVVVNLPSGTSNRLAHSLPSIYVTAPTPVYASDVSTASVPATSGATYQWKVTGGTLLNGQGTPSITFKPGCSGVARVEARVSTTSGVSTGLATVDIVAPSARATGSSSITAGQSAMIDAALFGVGPWMLWWSDGVTQSGVNGSYVQRMVWPTQTTHYRVIAVQNGSGCFGTTTGTSSVYVSP